MVITQIVSLLSQYIDLWIGSVFWMVTRAQQKSRDRACGVVYH